MVNKADMLPVFMGFIRKESDSVNTKYINGNCDAYCGREERDTVRVKRHSDPEGGQGGTQGP